MKAIPIALVGALMATPAMAIGMITAVRDISASDDECLAAATRAFEAAQFTKNLETVNTSVFGEYQAYTASIRCVTDNSVAFFVVAGPSTEQGGKLLDLIKENFDTDASPKKSKSGRPAR